MSVQFLTLPGRPCLLAGTPQVPKAEIHPYVIAQALENSQKNQSIGRPLSIGWICQGKMDQPDPRVQEIYCKIYNQIIQHDFVYNAGICGADETKNHCGYFRGFMGECRCYALDRRANPTFRRKFEDKVIDKIRDIFKTTCNINLVVFASGGLHGELTLMVRLIKSLKDHRCIRRINLFLIDRIYKNNIQKAFQFTNGPEPTGSYPWANFLGDRRDLEQLLREVTLGLPATIKFGGEMFESDTDYILRTKIDQELRCDLVIGADTETDGKVMGRIITEAQRTNHLGIALEKFDNIPQICDVDKNGISTPCVVLQGAVSGLSFAQPAQSSEAPYAAISVLPGVSSTPFINSAQSSSNDCAFI